MTSLSVSVTVTLPQLCQVWRQGRLRHRRPRSVRPSSGIRNGDARLCAWTAPSCGRTTSRWARGVSASRAVEAISGVRELEFKRSARVHVHAVRYDLPDTLVQGRSLAASLCGRGHGDEGCAGILRTWGSEQTCDGTSLGEPLLGVSPVDDVPPSGDVIGLNVLVLQVVSVLPHVELDDRDLG